MATTAPPTAPVPMPSRPLGVAILAFLVGLAGVLFVIVGLLIIAAASIPSIIGAPSNFLGTSYLIWGVFVLIIGLVIIGVALGLWHQRMWALVLAVLFLLFEIAGYALAHAWYSLGFILALLLLIYLLAVHRHFR